MVYKFSLKKIELLLLLALLVSCNPSFDKEREVVTDIPVELQKEKKDSLLLSIPATEEEPIGKNKFASVIKSVAQIDYALKEYKEGAYSQNFLSNRIQQLNKFREGTERELIPFVTTTGILKIRKAFIKGTKEVGNRLYDRAEIESWEMPSEAAAKSVYQEIEQIKATYNWEAISKSTITCFRNKNEIIFITPGGFYMLDRVDKIADYLKENL